MHTFRSLCLLLALVAAGLLVSHCGGSESRYNAPADHTVDRDGARHLPGSSNPTTNCTSCHGQDLRGGSSPASCFECHGKEW